ncbi:MAG: NAD(P)/FAD-dependent oxidoreductase [Planctomycetaceae bacterium]|nr:NAD(P)/FAD-dependent oxidoreductase [Planctomycetaceae bacterium]
MSTPVTRIVILGGGFAGTNVALTLERRFRRDSSVKITLIDGENFFTFTPLLPEVPSGSIQPKHIVFPLRALLRRTEVRQAHVKAIDLERRIIVAAHCGQCGDDVIEFDHLVLALGSVPNFFGTPGVEEHALTMKTLADATALHAHVIDKLEHADLQADPAQRRELLTFVVAGGGFAGVETLAELNDFVREAGRFYPRIQLDDIRLVLIHSGPRILPEVSESLSAYALRKLTSRGVEVLLQTRVQSCTASQVRLSNGTTIITRTFLWAAGTAPSPVLNFVDAPRTKTGRIDVEATLAVKGFANVWAVGDSASIPDVVTGGVCPPTAQFALRQGKRLAENIIATMQGQPPQPFRFKALGLLAGLGHRCAVAEVFGMRFSGFLAWWLWRTIYLTKLPGLERKLRVAIDWTFDLFFPRDIVFLRPLHTPKGEGVVSLGVEDEACPLPHSPAVHSATPAQLISASAH